MRTAKDYETQNRVFVLDKHHRPLMPCHPARARELLRKGKAVVHKLYPFTIRLKDKTGGATGPLRLKIDPGSKTTGLAIIRESDGYILWAADLHHKQFVTVNKDGKPVTVVGKRASLRRSRRSRKTRYRPRRINNRRRSEGWLPPTVRAKADCVLGWVEKLLRLCPITAISIETARFDTQKLQNPEISGVEYQQGTLFGYEVREYLLAKYGRECQYCHGKSKDPVLEIDHIVPRSRGGSDRVSNLTLACRTCNLDKGNKTAEEYGHPEVQAEAKKPLKDAAHVNAARWYIWERLKAISSASGLELEMGTGGRTKHNRTIQGLPKAHYLDAACVGASTPELKNTYIKPLEIRAVGRGNRRMARVDAYGFPKGHRSRKKVHFGFQTGDIVKAIVTKGKYSGVYKGTVAVRASGYFDIKDVHGKVIVQGINYKYMRLLQRADGYTYAI
ncbi:HNH endonuclease [Desulfofundulus australicus DSM 11792]|uniref:HNH endonuclease n=1 Tax=Desulfofundulus australicus DSM 11792 TaxID=1121425 RepID=A0A1M5E535_9FIRM|nr:RNA-guided endonuclease IscB [Desulfofundulus australicus]SHF74347.1 HNH endonuclease [Desulfofundulus australicus DSM 11792]